MIGRVLLLVVCASICLTFARRSVTKSDAAGNVYFDTGDAELMINGVVISTAIQELVGVWAANETGLSTASPVTAARPVFGSDSEGNLHVNMSGNAELQWSGSLDSSSESSQCSGFDRADSKHQQPTYSNCAPLDRRRLYGQLSHQHKL